MLAKLFTSSHLQRLARGGSTELIPIAHEVLRKAGLLPAESTLEDLFNVAFESLRRWYPVEYVFKTFLLKRRLFGKHSPRTTSCYFEWRVGLARADMLLVNGEAEVFEVKSSFDSAERLGAQLDEYYGCFSKVSVVVEDGEDAAYLKLLPEHVGVVTLTRDRFLSTKRQPQHHTKQLTHHSIYGLLRQHESDRIVSALGPYPAHLDSVAWYLRPFEHFASSLTVEDAQEQVTAVLRARGRTMRRAGLCKNLPDSLHVAAFSYILHRQEWDTLFRVLSTELGRRSGGGIQCISRSS